MRKYWSLVLTSFLLSPLLSFASGCELSVLGKGLAQQEDSLTISGTLTQGTENPVEKITFSYIDQTGKSQYSTAKLLSDAFELRVAKQPFITEGMLRAIGADPMGGAMQRPLSLFIEKDNIKVVGKTDQLELAIVSGGKENDDYNTLRQSTADIARKITASYEPLIKGEVKSDTEQGESLMKQMSALHRQEYEAQKRFVVEHPASYVSLFLLYRLKNIYTSDNYAKAFAAIDNRYHDTKLGKEIQSNIQREIVTAKGAKAQTFARTTATGKPFKLDDLKGKVFLIDFWGSWCGPCRASMPHLLELHEKYEDKGFEIVGVAQERGKTLDEANATWKKAIDELGIHWVNVLNNENQEQFDIVKSYAITGFPTKILVDDQGKVILRITASATDDIDVALKNIYGY